MSASIHNDDTTCRTTYQRNCAYRQLDIRALPNSKKRNITSPHLKKQRRRVRRSASAAGKTLTASFVLPGKSMTVGPVAVNQAPPLLDSGCLETAGDVSETLQIQLGQNPPSDDYKQWLITKLPEIMEQCCRNQEPQSASGEFVQAPVRRRIRINVSSSASNGAEVAADISHTPPESPSPRLVAHTSHPERAPSNARHIDDPQSNPQTHQQCRSRIRPQCKDSRPSSSEDLCADATSFKWGSSPRSPITAPAKIDQQGAVTPEAQATADLVRHVLKEMFGPHPSSINKVDAETSTGNNTATSSSSHSACQTSPRLTDATCLGTNESEQGLCNKKTTQQQTSSRRRQLQSPAQRVLPERRNVVPEKSISLQREETSSENKRGRETSPVKTQCPIEALRKELEEAPNTSRRILDTLTESNRLLSEMADFFRRSELADRITQRTDAQLLEAEMQDASRDHLQQKELNLPTSPQRRKLHCTSALTSPDGWYQQTSARILSFRPQVQSPTSAAVAAEIYRLENTISPLEGVVDESSQQRESDSVQAQHRYSRSAIHCGATNPAFRTGSDGEIFARQRQPTSPSGSPPPVARQHPLQTGDAPLPATVAARSWERQRRLQQRKPSPPWSPSQPRTAQQADITSSPSTTRSQWDTTVTQLPLHGADRPYQPLQSPPVAAAPMSAASGAGTAILTQTCVSSSISSSAQLPWSASPPGDRDLPPCSHRQRLGQEQSSLDVDSTDILLSYDPWTDIENDFKALLL